MNEVISRPWPQSERRTPHIFGVEARIAADMSPSGKNQIDRICNICGVVKVTVFGEGGLAWREWRLKGSDIQFPDDRVPNCAEVGS